MSCGCSGKVDPAAAVNHKLAQRSRAIICQTCIYAERSDASRFGLAVVSCDGRPIGGYINGFDACPHGKHPNQSGIVRWLGVRWFGVPMPLRVVMRPWLTGPVPGCGCIARLKVLWTRFQGKLRKSEVSHVTG